MMEPNTQKLTRTIKNNENIDLSEKIDNDLLLKLLILDFTCKLLANEKIIQQKLNESEIEKQQLYVTIPENRQSDKHAIMLENLSKLSDNIYLLNKQITLLEKELNIKVLNFKESLGLQEIEEVIVKDKDIKKKK